MCRPFASFSDAFFPLQKTTKRFKTNWLNVGCAAMCEKHSAKIKAFPFTVSLVRCVIGSEAIEAVRNLPLEVTPYPGRSETPRKVRSNPGRKRILNFQTIILRRKSYLHKPQRTKAR